MRDRATVTAFLAAAVLAGGNGVAVRFSNHELAPLWGATLRFFIAALVLFAVVGLRRVALPRGPALVGAVLYGLLAFAVTFALAYWGLEHVGAGVAQIVLALVPLLTFLLAVVQRLEPFAWRVLLGAVVAVVGIAIVFADQVDAAVPVGSLLAVVGAAAAMAESNVVIKRFPRANPLGTNAVAMGAAFVVLLVASFIAGDPHVLPTRADTWAAVAYVSVLGSVVVFSLFLYVIARWSASATSYVMLIIPLVTVAVAAVLDNEPVTWAYFVGGPLVVLGVYVGAFAPALRWPAARRPTTPVPAGQPTAWRAMTAPRSPAAAQGVAQDEPCPENPGCL